MAGEPGLFEGNEGGEGPPEDAPSDLFGAAAEAGERVRIGRPPGARNRKTKAFEDWYFARFKDPAVALGELVTMDPRALQQLLVEDRHSILEREGKLAEVPGLLELIKLQLAAASELMPYLHGKKPIDINVTDERLPTIIVVANENQLDQARRLLEERRQAALSIGAPLVDAVVNEINDLEPDT